MNFCQNLYINQEFYFSSINYTLVSFYETFISYNSWWSVAGQIMFYSTFYRFYFIREIYNRVNLILIKGFCINIFGYALTSIIEHGFKKENLLSNVSCDILIKDRHEVAKAYGMWEVQVCSGYYSLNQASISLWLVNLDAYRRTIISLFTYDIHQAHQLYEKNNKINNTVG